MTVDDFPKCYFEIWHDTTKGVTDKPQMMWALKREGSNHIYAQSVDPVESIGDFDWWIKHMWKDFKEASENKLRSRNKSEMASIKELTDSPFGKQILDA